MWGPPRGGTHFALETVTAAAGIGDYPLAHAQVAYRIMGADPATHDAERMMSWIRREQLTAFTLRDAHRRFRKPSPQDLLPALEVLELRSATLAPPRFPSVEAVPAASRHPGMT